MSRHSEAGGASSFGSSARGAETARVSDGADAVWTFLADLVSRSASGLLTIVAHDGVVSVALRSGWLVGVRAEHESEDTGLGEFLVSSGELSRQQFEELSEVGEAAGLRMREVLLQREIVHREVIESARREWAHETLIQTLLWEGAEFTFYSQHATPRIEALDPVPLAEILLESEERLATKLPSPADLPTAGTHYRVVSEDTAPDRPHSLDERRILAVFEPGASVRYVSERSGLSLASVRLIAWHLDRSGSLERIAGMTEEIEGRELATSAGSETSMEARDEDRDDAESRARAAQVAAGWLVTWSCIAVALIVLVVSLVVAPVRVALPLPTHSEAREEWELTQMVTARLALERATTIFGLLEGRMPESSLALVREGLIPRRRALLVSGSGVDETASEISTTTVEGTEIDGFFLRPPSTPESGSDSAPLVLLGGG